MTYRLYICALLNEYFILYGFGYILHYLSFVYHRAKEGSDEVFKANFFSEKCVSIIHPSRNRIFLYIQFQFGNGIGANMEIVI